MKKLFALFTSIFCMTTSYGQNGVGIDVANPLEMLDVAGAIKIGTTATNNAGTIRWTGTEFQGYDGTQWVTFTGGTGGSVTLDEAYDEGGSGAGRVITADNGAIRINGDDGFLVTGTHGSGDAIEVSGAGTRMFFNPSKSAFRTGRTTGTNWDDANIGNYSFAAGYNPMASANYSVALGYQVQATGSSSVALGLGAIASGDESFAVGEEAVASGVHAMAIGTSTVSSGLGTVAIGNTSHATNDYAVSVGSSTFSSGYGSVSLGNQIRSKSGYETVVGRWNEDYTPISTTTWNDEDRLFSIGNGTSASNRSNALTVLKLGYVGIGTSTPSTTLEVAGQVKITGGTPGLNKILTSDATGLASWVDPATLVTDNANTLDEAYDEGGAGAGRVITADNGAIRINGEDGFLVTGTHGSGDAIEVSGAGTRMFFNPSKSAFRTGRTTGTNWDDANIGNYSFAAGYNPMASANYSVALGYQVQATGSSSVALGLGAIASGDESFAVGEEAVASGVHAMAIGTSTVSSGLGTVAIGNTSHATNDYAVSVGSSTFSSGYGSVSLGNQIRSKSGYETVVGRWNEDYTPISTTTWNDEDRLFSIGNGTSASNRSNALTVLKLGYVGIGTSTPSTTLEVAGQVKITGGTPGLNKILTSDATGLASWVDPNTLVTGLPSATSGQTLRHNGSSWVANSNLFNNGLNVGIGETSPQATLHVKNGTTNQLRIESTGGEADVHFLGDAGVTWQAGTNNAGNGSTSGNQFYIYDSAYRLTVQSGSGNVGVGTSSPQSKLEIENGYNLSLSQPGFIGIGGATGRNITIDRDDIQGRNNGSAAQIDLQYFGGDLSACVGGGNVGIGIASPSQKLHVNGNLKVAGSYIYGAGSQYAFIGDSPTSSGGVTITPHAPNYGTLGTPSYYWDDAYVSEFYYQTQYTFSDRRVKQNIQPMESALEKVMLLKGVTYDINTDKHPFYQNLKEDEVENTKNIMGFIAQDIQEVFPGMISENDESGFLMVKNYEQLFPVLVEAVKELKLENDLLKARLEIVEQSTK